MSLEQRRLAAVVAVDVAGYSRLVGLDETGTLHRLSAHRSELIDPLVAERGGRIVKTMGDGLLVEFASVVTAVEWAIAVQQGMAQRNDGVPDTQAMRFRIGIHLGDVIADGDDILGDGVNIAARLESIAPVGGLAISAVVQDYLDKSMAEQFADSGERQLKNIRRPIRVWTWQDPKAPATPPKASARAAVETPSIAVLPFRSLNHEADGALLADAITEEITTILAQISGLFVISRISRSQYEDEKHDPKDVASSLGARYLLRGLVQMAGERVRVTAQLIDAHNGAEIWAERYDHAQENVLDLQDTLTKEIVTALRIKLTDGEQARVWLRSTENVRAWRYAMRGADSLWRGTPDATALAREFLDKAVAEDPNYAAALGLLGITYYIDLRFGYRGDPEVARRRIAECAEHGLKLDRTNPYVLVLRAIQLAVEKQFDEAVNAVHHAIAGNPNDAFVRVVAARILTNVERPAEAEREIRMAMRLNPHFSINYLAVLADALIIQGRLDEALATLRDLIGQDADYFPGHVYLIHLYMLMERTEDARREVQEVLRLDPDYSLAKATDFYLSSNATVNAAFLDNLKKAGVPA